MKTHVISVDLWGTIFDFNTEISLSTRRRQLVRFFAERRGVVDSSLVDEAYETASKHFGDTYKTSAVTITPRERLGYQLELIGINPDGADFDELVEDVQNAILYTPPPLAPNLKSGLGRLSEGFPLVVVSDTGFSPGKVIRKIFENYGIARYFMDYSFSDENGKSKPSPFAFTSVLDRIGFKPAELLHIGDMEWSDIKGAKSIGAKSCLYVGLSDQYLDDTQADFILRDWKEAQELVDNIE